MATSTAAWPSTAPGGVATWFGWVASIEADVLLVAESPERAMAARRDLGRIGADGVRAACIVPDLPARRDRRLRVTRRATFADLAAAPPDAGRLVIDVRERHEWVAGHLDGAVHVPVHELASIDIGSIRADDVWVHCAAEFRAAIAASLLEGHGIAATVIDDDFGGRAIGGRPPREGPARARRDRGMTPDANPTNRPTRGRNTRCAPPMPPDSSTAAPPARALP